MFREQRTFNTFAPHPGGLKPGEIVEKISYMNLPNSFRLSNGTVEVVVTTDIGPRVIRYGFIGGENLLAELPSVEIQTELGGWKPWGGHRLWTAPEATPRSYAPDNDPVEYRIEGEHRITLVQPAEKGTGIQKEMAVTLEPDGTAVTIDHRITNRNLWGVELAPWGLTIMNGGGTTILPQEPFRSHSEQLLPVRTMALWGYTDLSDPRWTIGRRFIRLRTDETRNDPQKVGILNRQGWGAYHRDDILFIKRFPFEEGAIYPDLGCNTETYTAGTFMEVESLGPLRKLDPGESVVHQERWYLFDRVRLADTDDELEGTLDPLLAGTAGF